MHLLVVVCYLACPILDVLRSMAIEVALEDLLVQVLSEVEEVLLCAVKDQEIVVLDLSRVQLIMVHAMELLLTRVVRVVLALAVLERVV